MSKAKNSEKDTLRPEYSRADLGKGERGKYFDAYQAGTNLVLLSPDVAKAFPTSDAVNDALRGLLQLAEQTEMLIHRSSTPGKKTPRRAGSQSPARSTR